MSLVRRHGLLGPGSLLLLAGLAPSRALADWTGPTVLLDAAAGAGAAEIGIGRGDVAAYDETPRPLLVADDGTLVLCDRVNARIVVLRPDGSRRASFGPQQLSGAAARSWLRDDVVLLGASIVTRSRDVLQRWDFDGSLLATASPIKGRISGIMPDGHLVLRDSGPVFRLFDASLVEQSAQIVEPALLGAFTTRTRSRIVRDATSGESTIAQDVELVAGGRTTTLSGLDGGVLDVVVGRDGAIFVTSEAIDPSRTVVREYPDGSRQSIELPHAVVVEHAPSGQRVASVALPPTEFPPFEQLVSARNFESTPTVVIGDVSIDREGHVYVYSYDAARFRILKWTRATPGSPGAGGSSP